MKFRSDCKPLKEETEIPLTKSCIVNLSMKTKYQNDRKKVEFPNLSYSVRPSEKN